jgi:hypothetical protein
MKRFGIISVNKLIDFLSVIPIYITNCPVTAKEFYIAFETFGKQVLNGTIDIDNNLYKSWILKRLTAHPTYRAFTISDSKEEIRTKLKKDAELVTDIATHGLRETIKILQDVAYEHGYFEIDGHHRVTVYKILNKKVIPFECDAALYEIYFRRMQTQIVNLNRDDFF